MKVLFETERNLATKDCKDVSERMKFFGKRLVYYWEGQEGGKSHSPCSCCFQDYLQFPFLEKDLGDRNIKAVVSAACYMRAFSLFSITMINIFM